MTKFQAIRLIAAREIRERTRSRIYRIGLLLTVVLVVVAVVAPALTKSTTSRVDSYSVGVVEPAPAQLLAAIEQLGPSLGADINAVSVETTNAGETKLKNGEFAALLVPGHEIVTDVAIDPNINSTIGRLTAGINGVAHLYAGFSAQGVTPEQTAAALEFAPLPERGLEAAPHRDSKGASSAGAGMVLLFVFLTLYGAFILNGVIEEKSSRVVEILLSTVRPQELLIGKVIGIGIVGSIQGVVLVIATFIARASTPSTSSSSLTTSVLLYTLLWFAIGFGIFAWLYACAGALVSRSEDAQNLVFPLQLPLVASYLVGLLASVNGPNPALTIMSFIPLTAPMTMLERMAAQEVPLWQVLVSIGLCLITIYLVMKLAIAIFSGGVLKSGGRVKIREALKSN